MTRASKRFQRCFKSLRKKGWSQKDIAAKLNISENSISKLSVGEVTNPTWRLGANLISIDDDCFPATLPSGIDSFQDLIVQLSQAGWTQGAMARSVNCSRTVISYLSTLPGSEPRFELGNALLRLYARSIPVASEPAA